MRTTIDLEKPLLERAKRRAARQGQTLSQLVRDAVGTYLAGATTDDEEPFEVITCGDAGAWAPTPAEMAAVLEEDDLRLAPTSSSHARP